MHAIYSQTQNNTYTTRMWTNAKPGRVPVYTAVHSVYGPGTRPYLIRTRPCTRPCTVHTIVFKACTRPRERTVYMAVHGCLYGLCTRPYTAVNVSGTRPCTGYVPCTRACLRFRPMNTALFTARVHGRSRVHGQGPCSRSVHGGHGRERPSELSVNTTVYTVHGRVERR